MTTVSLSYDARYDWAAHSRNIVAATVIMAVTAVPAAAAEVSAPSLNCRLINTNSDIRLDVNAPDKANHDVGLAYQPRTALGVKLLALRRAYLENGGALLDEAAFEAKLRSRRGGVNA
jgi:hypothetical protein